MTGEVLPIAKLGQPVLLARAGEVADPAAPEIGALAASMLATMRSAGGVGIAAPQVSVSLRVVIVASAPGPRYPDAPFREPMVMVNPERIALAEETVRGWEGCLSIPGLRGVVPRPVWVRARWLELDGEVREETLEGFVARVFLHELDHLDGVLFVDRVAGARDLSLESEMGAATQVVAGAKSAGDRV